MDLDTLVYSLNSELYDKAGTRFVLVFLYLEQYLAQEEV